MQRPHRPAKQRIHRDIQAIIRTFDASYVLVSRAVLTSTVESLGEETKKWLKIWAGEALIRPVSSTAQRLEMGEINTENITILIAGSHKFEIGDFVTMKKHLYQIQRVNNPLGAYDSIDLIRYQQQTAPLPT